MIVDEQFSAPQLGFAQPRLLALAGAVYEFRDVLNGNVIAVFTGP